MLCPRPPLLRKTVPWVVPAALALLCLPVRAATGAAPASATQLLAQGRSLVDRGQLAEALLVLRQAHDAAPRDLAVLTLLGKVECRLGDSAEGLPLLRQVAERTPRSAQAHVDLAIALSDAGQLPLALEETAKALAISPRLAEAHLNRARILADLHRVPEARAEFARTERLAPGIADTYFYWAIMERQEGDFARETDLLQHLVKLQPDNAKAFFLLGRVLSEHERNPEAIAALRRALALDPNDSEALYLLSRKVQRSDPEEAKALMEKHQRLRQNAQDVEAAKTLGNQAYDAASREQWAEAIEYLRQALAACRDCEIAGALHRNLGLDLCRDGLIEEGARELHTALGIDPNDTDAAKALAILGR